MACRHVRISISSLDFWISEDCSMPPSLSSTEGTFSFLKSFLISTQLSHTTSDKKQQRGKIFFMQEIIWKPLKVLQNNLWRGAKRWLCLPCYKLKSIAIIDLLAVELRGVEQIFWYFNVKLLTYFISRSKKKKVFWGNFLYKPYNILISASILFDPARTKLTTFLLASEKQDWDT